MTTSRPSPSAEDHPGPARRPWLAPTLAYVALAALICFAFLGRTDVVSMEGIVADGARHMARHGIECVPHLYNEPYFVKPAMLYWLVLGAERIAGHESEWILRAPVACCGFALGLVVLVLVGRRSDPRSGFLAALATLTGALTLQKLPLAEFDLPLAAGVGVAIAAACSDLAAPTPRLRLWLLTYAGLTFALLSKGLAAIPPFFPGLILAALFTRRIRRFVTWQHLLALALCATVVGLYIAGVWREAGPAVFAQPLTEARTRTSVWSIRTAVYTLAKPGLLFIVFLPWTPLALFAGAQAWRSAQPGTTRLFATGAWGFLLGGLFALLLVPQHQTRYFLPLATPVGILAGLATAWPGRAPPPYRPHPELAWWCAARDVLLGVCATAMAILAIIAGVQTLHTPLPPAHRALLIALGSLTLIAVFALRRRIRLRLAVPVLMALCTWAVLTLVDRPHRAETRSLRAVAAEMDPWLPRTATVWLDMRDDQSSLIYYLGRPAQAYRAEYGWPPPGSFVLLYPEQADELADDPEFWLLELAWARGAGVDFVLGHIESSDADDFIANAAAPPAASRPQTAPAPAPDEVGS